MSPLVFALNASDVIVSWLNSFQLNGPLERYTLWVDGNKQLLGRRTSYRHPRETKEATYVFEVEATTATGSVRSPKTVFDVTQPDFRGTLPTPGPTPAAAGLLYKEVWFIILLVLLVCALLLALLVVAIKCFARRNSPYVRERRPLQPRQPRVPLPPTPLDAGAEPSKGRGKGLTAELSSSGSGQYRNPAYLSNSVLELSWEHDSTPDWEPAAFQYDSAFNSLVYEGEEDSMASSLPPKLILESDTTLTSKSQVLLTDTHI